MSDPDFTIIRLGKDSVAAIHTLDSFHNSPDKPVNFSVTCTQVPLAVETGYYCFICLGSDNSKGAPTEWNKGLRAFGKILEKTGGPKWKDRWEIKIEVKVILTDSISHRDFLARAPKEYYWFSGIPMIGISSYSNQTVQQIKSADDPTQNVRALFSGISAVNTEFKIQIQKHYNELCYLFDYETPEEKYEGQDSPAEYYGWDEYPLDSVFVRKEQRTVNEVVKRINKGRFVLNPDFQRDFVWDLKKQSRLIESCLMRIPLPVLYVAEAKDGKIIVVDGLQRLSTFTNFLNNKFAIKNISPNPNESGGNGFIGKRFKDLSITLQERIEDTQLTLYILDANAPERAKLDIFERVNSGEILTRQQMRNCLFTGQATKWLKKASKSKSFLKVTDGSISSKTMRDREVINRFCAFHLLGTDHYTQSDMDGFLARALEKMNTLNEQELDELFQIFEHSMEMNYVLFGRHAFRKSLSAKYQWSARSVINISLFDVCSVLLSDIEEDLIKTNSDSLKRAIKHLFEDYEFIQAITIGTNSVNKVNIRFKKMRDAISEII
ncbi:DUF262 domain-containing protein [Desulfobacula toluolica]|uniref:Conserved uncharacterized protein, DUF262 n=1 Tax=Desulfobacula toluolica (strain DSM 7467 / Tol2) TaxID=651182 RepID=K0NHZ2_DESTT|nr:DUF262 domain-containing protein [Desulfobacula toluolica]CCK78582.1 conserved uncharacterized protein, DUF262 [Desulfobacula toluolica Tol2]